MSTNAIATLIVSTIILLVFPPTLYFNNKFGIDIRRWLPNQGERERFIMSAGLTAVMMAAIATVTVFFKDARSVSAALFLSTVITLDVALATAQSDEKRLIHLLIYETYTLVYFVAGIALLNAYSFDFNVDTPWVLTAILSSLVIGTIVGGLMTTSDPGEKKTLTGSLLAFVGASALVVGFCMMAESVSVGLLIIGVTVVIASIVQYVTDDSYAHLTAAMGIIILAMSAIGFAISQM